MRYDLCLLNRFTMFIALNYNVIFNRSIAKNGKKNYRQSNWTHKPSRLCRASFEWSTQCLDRIRILKCSFDVNKNKTELRWRRVDFLIPVSVRCTVKVKIGSVERTAPIKIQLQTNLERVKLHFYSIRTINVDIVSLTMQFANEWYAQTFQFHHQKHIKTNYNKFTHILNSLCK